MSELGSGSAIRRCLLNVRVAPESGRPCATLPCRTSARRRHTHCNETVCLFDHLVGAGEQRRRNSKAERFGSLEVEHRFILGRRLHRQISRFLAFENLPM